MGVLDGQRAIVTGGGSGIGAAVARVMAEQGARVAVLDLSEERGQAVADEVGGVAFPVNVVDGDAVEQAVAAAVDALGGLSCLVNNAGIGSLKPLHDYTSKEWDLLVDVNLKGTFNGLRAAVPHLRVAAAADPGTASVVNIASVSGIRPTRGESPYGAAKAGVISLTMSGALEYGPDGIRVNCVSPGFIRTQLTEFRVRGAGLHLGHRGRHAPRPHGHRRGRRRRRGLPGQPAGPLRHRREPGGRRREPAPERPDGSHAARPARRLTLGHQLTARSVGLHDRSATRSAT